MNYVANKENVKLLKAEVLINSDAEYRVLKGRKMLWQLSNWHLNEKQLKLKKDLMELANQRLKKWQFIKGD